MSWKNCKFARREEAKFVLESRGSREAPCLGGWIREGYNVFKESKPGREKNR